jgi:hypothetical protein
MYVLPNSGTATQLRDPEPRRSEMRGSRKLVSISALSNAATEDGVDDLGLHLMDARYPLSVPEGSSNEVAVDAKAPGGYVGSFELSANFILTVTREGDP